MTRTGLPRLVRFFSALACFVLLVACSTPPPPVALRIGVFGNDFVDPEHPAIGVVVARSVQSWKDLRAKQIATNVRNSITTAAIVGRLRQEGVDGYTFVEMSFANMGLAVAGGNVAAAGMNEPFLTQSLLRGDGNLLGWGMGGAPFSRAQLTSIVFSADVLRRNPAAVKGFLRAVACMEEGAADYLLKDRLGRLGPAVAQALEARRLRMPGMDGPAFYREATRRHPELARRFVFLTGDALSPEMRRFLAATQAPSVDKPFTLEDLRRALEALRPSEM